MKILQKLTIQNLRKNQRRTLVTIIGVMLSSALILAVVGMVTSMQKMMINYAIAQDGNFHDMFQEVPAEKLPLIENNNHVSAHYYSEPVTKNTVEADTFDSYELYQNAPYSVEHYQKLDQLPADASGKYNIFVRYDQPRNYEEYRRSILDALGEEINVRTNSELLRYEAGIMGDAILSALYQIAAVVVIIIIVSSVFVIRNSFSISATERSRQFGMLASIGATPKQIRHSVIFEGLIIGAIGVPLGLILGAIATFVLVIIVNFLLQDMIIASVEFSLPLWIFPITIGLSFITIFLSSLVPAIRAGKMSPIEAIRGNNDIKIKPRKLKTSKLTREIFGVGGVIASKNLKRSRKKYRTTVISIVVSVATFVGLSSFLSYGEKMVGLQYVDEDIDYVISNADPQVHQKVIDKFQVKDWTSYYPARTLNVNAYFMDKASFADYAKSLGINEKDYSKTAILVDQAMSMNDNGSYTIDKYFDLKDGDKMELEIATAQDPKTGNYDTTNTKKVPIDVTKVTTTKPLSFSHTFAPMLFLPEGYYLEKQIAPDVNFGQLFLQHLDFNPKELDDYLDELKEQPQDAEIYYQNMQEALAQSRRIVLLFGIFLYGFITVVTLIGVTNIFNTITTNIALRSKEFAMLKSVGMTSREFNHMIRLESLMYVTKALIIGLPLGILISYAFYQSFAEAVDFGFSVPWEAILISIFAVAILIGVIMHYSVKQVAKQNIIETIREENIWPQGASRIS